MLLSTNERTVLRTIAQAEKSGNVMEILNWPVSKFEEGFALANRLQNLDTVKLLYSNFNKNLIVVELTLVGELQAKQTAH